MQLEKTVQQLAPDLLRFCSGHCGDRPTAEDIAQESLAALVSRWRRLKDADATGVFDALARLLGADLVLDPTVDGKLSIELENVGLEEALREICEALDCKAELLIEGDKRTLEVSAAAAG